MYRVLIILLLVLNIGNTYAQTDWKLKKDNDGIRVYVGEVQGSKFKAVKVECMLNASASQLVKVLFDVSNCPDWVDHTKSCSLLKQVSPSELYYYSEVDIPWPAKNRDFVAHLTAHQNPETKVVTVDGPAVSGYVSEKKGIVRIQSSKGLWIITPLSKSRVNVIYTLQVDPGGNIPAWLVNMLAADSPMKSFEGLKEELKKPAYQHARLAFIQD